VFAGCWNLISIIVDVNNPNYSSQSGILYNKNKTVLLSSASDSITIPSSVSSIGKYAFHDSSITNVIIPSSVTSIGDCAFLECTRLTSVTIPASVTSIPAYAFSGCGSLRNVTIPSSVTSIGDCAFQSCRSLTSVTIPASVMSIGYMAFANWRSSQTINVQGKANLTEAVAVWGSGWRSVCEAVIKFINNPGSGTDVAQWYTSNPSGLNFTITNATELAELAQIVNGTHETITRDSFSGKTISLANDIDLSAYGSGFNGGNGWIPIGSSHNITFNGTFDGNSKTINDLFINSSSSYMGLFGCISGVVKNLSVSGNVTGGSITGGVVGYVPSGNITNCSFSGNVITVSGQDVGGIAGINGGYIQNCFSNSSVTGNTWVGGVVGSNNGTVQNCYSIGSVNGDDALSRGIGGVVGCNNRTVENCYSTSSVKGYQMIGGIMGRPGAEYTNYNAVPIVRNCVTLNTSVIADIGYGRVGGNDPYGSNYVTYTNNYGRSGLSGTSSLNGSGGESIISVSTLTWWTNETRWSTANGASAWDFTNIWEWNSGTNRPKLRNVGGQ